MQCSSQKAGRESSAVCVCVLFDSVRQTELEPAARHTQHTPPLDELHTMLLLLSLSEDGGYAGLEGMSCAFSFFLSVTQAELRDKTAFESDQVSQSRVCRSHTDAIPQTLAGWQQYPPVGDDRVPSEGFVSDDKR